MIPRLTVKLLTMKYFHLISIIIFSSCSTYNNNPVTTLSNDKYGKVKIVSGDQQNLKSINIISTFKETLNNKMLAKVEVENRSNKPKVFMYKFDWIDSDGNLDTDSSKWKTSTISGKEVKNLEGVDIRGRAVDFRILIKRK